MPFLGPLSEIKHDIVRPGHLRHHQCHAILPGRPILAGRKSAIATQTQRRSNSNVTQ